MDIGKNGGDSSFFASLLGILVAKIACQLGNKGEGEIWTLKNF